MTVIITINLEMLADTIQRWFKKHGEAVVKKQLQEISSSLDLLLRKSDQMIWREMRSAYSALIDAAATHDESTRRERILFAENNLLKNTGLDRELTTEEMPNNELMAIAHYGLAEIAADRSDTPVTVRHTLEVFRLAPRKARMSYYPELYEYLFKPECAEIFKWEKHEQQRIDHRTFPARTAFYKSSGVAAAVGGLALISTGHAYGVLLGKAAQDLLNKKPSDFREKYRQQLAAEKDRRLDERCREIAESLLGEQFSKLSADADSRVHDEIETSY